MENEYESKIISEKLDSLKSSIIAECDHLIWKISNIKDEALRKDTSLNSLGELQGNVLNLDRLIITYEVYKKAIHDYIKVKEAVTDDNKQPIRKI